MPGQAIARDVSPFLRREGELARFLMDPKGERRHEVPADPATLRAIRDEILRILAIDYGRTFAHVVPNTLRAEADHYVGVHVMGYEFNESGSPDCDMERWRWRTGLGCYSDDPLRPWTTDLAEAASLARRACPDLRVDLRLGGKGHGLPRAARFARGCDAPGLAGAPVPLPEAWPRRARDYPAAAICCVALEAAAMEKEARAAARAVAAA